MLNKENQPNLNVKYQENHHLTFNGSREPEKSIVVLNLKFTMKVTNKFLLFMMYLVRIKMSIPAEHQTMEAQEHPGQT